MASGAKEQSPSLAMNGREAPDASGEGVIYDSFDPLILQQNAGQEVLSFPTYNAALDEFYAKVTVTSTPYNNKWLKLQGTFP